MDIPQWFKDFMAKQSWIFAQSYAKKAPHEYIVRDDFNGSDDEFMSAVNFILQNGMTMCYYGYHNKYIYLEGKLYWVMRDNEEDPTTVLNRSNTDEYEYSIRWKGPT